MIYGMFLYKTKARRSDALAVKNINRAILENSAEAWEWDYTERNMLEFDAERVKREVLERLTADGASLCKAEVRYTPNNIGYIHVVTSYENAERVLTVAVSVAVENGLAVFDVEMNRTVFLPELYRNRYVSMRLRAQLLNGLIVRTQRPVYHLRRLELTSDDFNSSCSYVVTLSKDGSSLEERTARFYELLKSNLSNEERLETADRCFTVRGDGYAITYCVEGYKKSADRLGCIEDGSACAVLMKRMPCEIALKQCDRLTARERDDVYARMRFIDWVIKYPNPAERFAASVDLAKQLRKCKFRIAIRNVGPYGSNVVFHLVDKSTLRVSALAMEEESASFILPIVETVYPYIYQRYYSPNHLPCAMMEDILNRVKAVRETVISGRYDEELEMLSRRFNLYELAEYKDGNYFHEDNAMIQNDRMGFIRKRRFEIARLYDIFISWVEDQIKYCWDYDSVTFNIEGP